MIAGACAGESDQQLADGASDRPTSTTDRSSATAPTVEGPSTTSSPPTVEADAVVVDVIDGDTFEMRVGGVSERVRIVGINAPETGECLAADATGWLRDRIADRAVELVRDDSDRDDFGRLLRYVEVDGTDVGVGLVEAGLAIARRYPPDTARAGALEAAQRRAEASQTGMWGDDACGPARASDVAIGEVRFDAAGDDNQNLNDEWVRIVNRGSTVADLTGWTLKDESASHRYAFPSGFVLDAGASVTVRSGCGPDGSTDLHWCQDGSAVWNNSGDTAFLVDPAGNIVDSRRA